MTKLLTLLTVIFVVIVYILLAFDLMMIDVAKLALEDV